MPPPSSEALRDLREILPYPGDEGELIGKHPGVPSEILAGTTGKKSSAGPPGRCLDCCCGVASEVRKCTAVNCPSWAFRMGTNPFRAKRVLSAEQKRATAERLARLKRAASLTAYRPSMRSCLVLRRSQRRERGYSAIQAAKGPCGYQFPTLLDAISCLPTAAIHHFGRDTR